MQYDADFLARSRLAFLDGHQLTIADLRRRIEDDQSVSPNQRRDLVSAIKRTAALFGRTPESISAHPATIRRLFEAKTAGELGLTPKTYANIRAALGQAIRLYGPAVPQLTKRLPMAPVWQELLRKIPRDYQRQGLYRLATYSSAMGITPTDVRSETLRGLYEALEAEELVKKPRNILKLTISSWNRAVRETAGWPQIRLSTPFAREPWTLPLSAFPVGFQSEVTGWARRMRHPDPFAPDAPPRPLREATVDHRILQFRQFASSLVHDDQVRISDVTSISVLLVPERFKQGLRSFIQRAGGKPTPNIRNLANALRFIAKHHCKFDPDTLKELEEACRKLGRGSPGQMTPKNRERLRQFDDELNIDRLLSIADAEMARAGREKNPLRAAKRCERALAWGLLASYAPRLRTLRTLKVSDIIFMRGRPKFLSIRADETKNDNPLEFELTDQVAGLAHAFLTTYRPRLPGAEGPYLFPGMKGGPRSKNAMYESICKTAKDAGLVMNPHLFRHALGKIAIERNPDAIFTVSRVLGHKSINTTLSHYLGTESKAAGKHLDSILNKQPKI